MWLLLCILLNLHCFADVSMVGSTPHQVRVREPFTLDLNVDLPPKAERAFQSYCRLLVASRPLPFPLFLEKVQFRKNGVSFVARLLAEGNFTIPLGTFYWKEMVVPLPSLSMQSLPLQISQPTLENYALPFPESVVEQTMENRALQKKLNEKENLEGMATVLWQYRAQFLLGITFLFLLFLPLLFQYEKWRKLSRSPVIPSGPTPEQRLHEIKKGEASWTPLLELLNTLNKEEKSLTAHELRTRFSKRGDEKLSQASFLLEQYAYRSEKAVSEFEQAVQCVEERIKDSAKTG